MLRVIAVFGAFVSFLYAAYQAMVYGGWAYGCIIAVVTAYFSGKAMAFADVRTALRRRR